MAEAPSLAEIARTEGISRAGVVRAFAAVHGVTPYAWLAIERLKEARRRLSGGDPAGRVAADLGFADQAHMTRAFKAAFAVTPARHARA